MMKRLGLWVALSVAALVIGCNQGGSTSPSSQKGPPPSAASAKAALEGMAKSGMAGSGMQAVNSYITSLRTTDAAKAEALDKELKDMLKGGSPDALKAKAKALADKL
jgi:hypothetical protein